MCYICRDVYVYGNVHIHINLMNACVFITYVYIYIYVCIYIYWVGQKLFRFLHKMLQNQMKLLSNPLYTHLFSGCVYYTTFIYVCVYIFI